MGSCRVTLGLISAPWLGDSSCSGWDGTGPATRQGTLGSLFQWDLLQDHGGEQLWLGMQGFCQPVPITASHPLCAATGQDEIKSEVQGMVKAQNVGGAN